MGDRVISIDVIVPSYRLQSEYLIPIVSMNVPDDVKVRYLIIADNPAQVVPLDFQRLVDDKRIMMFRNRENGGSSKSRNVGIDNSNAEWVLFLDDDIKPSIDLLFAYRNAILQKPDEIGFFGETLFPPPKTTFTKGVIASDILTFFFLAGYYDQLKWAPTANVIIKRSAIADIRFLEIFPKNGGGEDIDFFLKIHRNTKKELQCLKNAPVYHDWWYNQNRNYTRFTRWSFGDTLMHDTFPEYTYYNFPNIIESLVLGIPIGLALSLFVGSPIPTVSVLLGILIGELVVEFLRMLIYKGIAQSRFALEASLIRASNDIGRLTMQIIYLKRIKGFCERFDHFCDGKHIAYQRVWGGIKFFVFIVCSTSLFYMLY